jgi:hypothetical protein
LNNESSQAKPWLLQSSCFNKLRFSTEREVKMTPEHPTPRKRFKCGERPDRPGMYLALFHGREGRREQMHEFGFAGPLLGPLRYCHTTYLSDIKIMFETQEDARLYCGCDERDVILSVVDDMIYLENAYYGDWSVFTVDEDECQRPNDTFRNKPRSNLMFGHRSHENG